MKPWQQGQLGLTLNDSDVERRIRRLPFFHGKGLTLRSAESLAGAGVSHMNVNYLVEAASPSAECGTPTQRFFVRCAEQSRRGCPTDVRTYTIRWYRLLVVSSLQNLSAI